MNDQGSHLLQKVKNKPISLNENNILLNEERTSCEQNNINYKYNNIDKIKNHFMMNNTTDFKNIKSCVNHNKPIRINYNMEIEKDIEKDYNINQKNENNSIYDKYKKIQNKIDNMKKKIGFEGSNEEFIEHLKMIKLKAEITNLVENMFTNNEDSKDIDEEETKKCFQNLEKLINNKVTEDKNMLSIYQYLVEQLLKVNNI